jgi:Chitobiase/beta-hexosaminidase C-terminal domain
MSTGVLPWEELTKKLNLNTGFFETSQTTLDKQMRVIAGNWDGAGMSAGNMQYNWGTADRLTELFNHMFANHENVVEGAFGGNVTNFQKFKEVCTTYTRAQKIAWGDSITDPDNEHRIIDEWLVPIGNLMVTPECYAKYVEIMDKYYLQDALFVFRQMSCTSRMSLASFFDCIINKGRYYPINTLQAKFDEIDTNRAIPENEKEAQKIWHINFYANEEVNALNDASSDTFRPRRSCMGNQTGDYFGLEYDPKNLFDMNQEPALLEKVEAQPEEPTEEQPQPQPQPQPQEERPLGVVNVEGLCLGNQTVTSLSIGANISQNPQPVEIVQALEVVPSFTTDKAPQTQFRTNPNSYAGIGAVTSVNLDKEQPLWVDVQNYVACRTYFTTDGSEPSSESNLLMGSLKFTQNTTLKTKTISIFGVAEATKTLEILINETAPVIPNFWRYVRFTGHGDNTGITTRLVELQAMQGETNRLLNRLPMEGYSAPAGGNIAVATDGIITYDAGYPFWWEGEGVPVLTYDLGNWYDLTMIKVVMYSPAIDPRQTQFKIEVSADDTAWYMVANYENNTTPQSEEGFGFAVAFA